MIVVRVTVVVRMVMVVIMQVLALRFRNHLFTPKEAPKAFGVFSDKVGEILKPQFDGR